MAVGSNGAVVQVGELRAAKARIKKLERALGPAAMENEILRAARNEKASQP